MNDIPCSNNLLKIQEKYRYISHGHTGKIKCLPKDKSIISRNPLLNRLDVGRKGVAIHGAIKCFRKTFHSAKLCTKNNRTYGQTTAQHLRICN